MYNVKDSRRPTGQTTYFGIPQNGWIAQHWEEACQAIVRSGTTLASSCAFDTRDSMIWIDDDLSWLRESYGTPASEANNAQEK